MNATTRLLPVREFPDRGAQWLLEAPDNVRGLLRILAPDLADRIDFARIERIETTFVPDNLRKVEADLLFRAPLRNVGESGECEVLIYLLIEHQSTPDRAMGLRLLSYMVNLWNREQRAQLDEGRLASEWRLTPVVPIVFYTGSARWTTELGVASLMDLPTGCEQFVPQHKTLMLNLKATPPEGLVREEHPLGWVLRIMQKEDAPQEELKTALREAVEHLDRLPDTEQAAWERAIYYILLLIYHRRAPAEHRPLQEVVEKSVQERRRREEVRTMGLTAAQALIEEGKQLGLLEGKQLGLLEGKQEMLLEQLRLRFGELPPAVEEQVRTTRNMEQLNAWIRAVLNAPTLEAMGFNL